MLKKPKIFQYLYTLNKIYLLKIMFWINKEGGIQDIDYLINLRALRMLLILLLYLLADAKIRSKSEYGLQFA